MEAIEVPGEASEAMLARLHEKAQILGEDGRVMVQPVHAGFARLMPRMEGRALGPMAAVAHDIP